MATIRQVKTKDVSLQAVMSRKPFMRGFAEAQKGTEMDYDAFNEDTNSRWQYERGRIFGLLYHGPLKQGRRVLYEAQVACSNAIKSGIML